MEAASASAPESKESWGMDIQQKQEKTKENSIMKF